MTTRDPAELEELEHEYEKAIADVDAARKMCIHDLTLNRAAFLRAVGPHDRRHHQGLDFARWIPAVFRAFSAFYS